MNSIREKFIQIDPAKRESRFMLTHYELCKLVEMRIDQLSTDPDSHTLGDLSKYNLSSDKNTQITQIALYEVLEKSYDPSIIRRMDSEGLDTYYVELFYLHELEIDREKIISLINDTITN